MRFFFVASIHGKQHFEHNYAVIEQEVKRLGHDLDASCVMDYTHESIEAMDERELIAYNKIVINGMKRADAIVLELSYSSTSVGYNLATAVQLGKPVIIFYSGKEEPHILRTLEKMSEKLQVIRYNGLDELRNEIASALSFAADTQDTRFNFFISPSQSHYLDWIAKNKKISRSVYLRSLINSDMVLDEAKDE